MPWRRDGDGLTITIRLTPRGGRDAIDGIEVMPDGRMVLKVRVSAAPVDGEANKALIALFSSTLSVPRSRISLGAGASSRMKALHLAGDPQRAIDKLGTLLFRSA